MMISSENLRRFFKEFHRKELNDRDCISAGVLVPIFEQDGELHVILTVRTNKVEHHKGQISFPGGTKDTTDTTLIETALREAEEEIGLARITVQVLGVLNDFQTPSGFCITPVVALLSSLPSFSINTAEVSEVFYVPLAFFLNAHNEKKEHLEHFNKKAHTYFYQYERYEIWGATAAIIQSFLYDFKYWLKNKKTL
jgi:8-oxo-dGTP pyrophosphatase MutT (NUDIX family)